MSRKPPTGTQLNLSHPMAKDLIFFCAMDRNGDQIDLVNNYLGVIDDSGGGAELKRVTSPAGLAQEFDAQSSQYKGFDFDDYPIYNPSALTIISQVKLAPSILIDSGWNRVVSKRTNTIGDDVYALLLSNAQTIRFRVNGSELNLTFASALHGVVMDLAASIESGVSKAVYGWAYRNSSTEFLSATASGVSVNSSTGHLCVGMRWQDARGWDGEIRYVAIWKVYKSRQFIEAFRLDPYQIFQPQRILIPMTAAEVVEQMGPSTTVFVTDVNTTETWVDGDTGIPITGTGFV